MSLLAVEVVIGEDHFTERGWEAWPDERGWEAWPAGCGLEVSAGRDGTDLLWPRV